MFVSKKQKFVVLPLCLVLLVIPIVILSSNGEPEIPNYENGIWREGPFPEGCYIPPDTIPNVTVVGPPPSRACMGGVMTPFSAGNEQKIQVAIYLAIEEEFYYQRVFTPYGKLYGWLYALLQIERASEYFESTFNVELVVVGMTTWHQDEEQDLWALYEVYEETEFQHNGYVPPYGYIAEVLVAWTSELKYGPSDTHGIALLYEPFQQKWYWTCIQRYCAYWMDDNLAQHEISHLLNASDGKTVPGTEVWSECYKSDCVMSYRTDVDVETVEEDGIIWEIPQSERPIGVTFLFNTWCEDSQEEINEWKWLYAQRDWYDPPYEGDC